tara:strand:- start:723 stop:986 length:264 start_codon:yes stop_codon:yes gene_type:complete
MRPTHTADHILFICALLVFGTNIYFHIYTSHELIYNDKTGDKKCIPSKRPKGTKHSSYRKHQNHDGMSFCGDTGTDVTDKLLERRNK